MNEQHPGQRGFVMPAEWEPHAGTLLAWPRNCDTWPNNLLEAQQEFVELMVTIARDEKVHLIAASKYHVEINQHLLPYQGEELPIEIYDVATNDAWVRDYGPTFVSDGQQLVAVDWQYNAWGGKYPPFDNDQKVVRRIVGRLGDSIERFDSKLCLEGGAIEIDSCKIAMCTRSCAFDPNRNPGHTAEQIELEIVDCIGATELIWLPGDAIEGDDTDGHIDQLARFAPGNRILVATTTEDDLQFEALQKNKNELQQQLERLKLKYELISLPVPTAVNAFGNRIPASYCNFYITNRSVIVPEFGVPGDRLAKEIIAACFKDRSIIGLPSVNLSVGLGSFHCLSQQIPITQ